MKPSEKCKVLTFSLSPATIEKLERLCKETDCGRSQFLKHLIDGADSISGVMLLNTFFEAMTGKKPSPESMKEAIALALETT